MNTEKDLADKLKTIPSIHWTKIETSTEAGIPDLNGICDGVEFWAELKIYPVRLRPAQVAWHYRALKEGRKAFVIALAVDVVHLYRVLKTVPVAGDKHSITDGFLAKFHISTISSIKHYLTKSYK